MVVVDVVCGLVLACLKVCCMLVLGAAIGLLLAPSVASATVGRLDQVTAMSSSTLGSDAPVTRPASAGTPLAGLRQLLGSPSALGDRMRRVEAFLEGE